MQSFALNEIKMCKENLNEIKIYFFKVIEIQNCKKYRKNELN